MHESQHLRLDTPRLLLRPTTRADALALFSLFSNPAVTRYLSHPPWRSVDTALERIAADEQAMSSGKYYRFCMERVDHQGLIGECSLFNIAAESRRAEIGYVLDPGSQGRGYMAEALNALLQFAFGELDLNRLEADIDPRNEASARTLERLGFRKEGHLRERWIVQGEVSDSSFYGLLRSDLARLRPSHHP